MFPERLPVDNFKDADTMITIIRSIEINFTDVPGKIIFRTDKESYGKAIQRPAGGCVGEGIIQ